MKSNGALEEDLRRYKAMCKELKREERRLPVTIFWKGKGEHTAASTSRDNAPPDPAFYYY
jgi:hypothetical protein